jgi:hypothetical protein
MIFDFLTLHKTETKFNSLNPCSETSQNKKLMSFLNSIIEVEMYYGNTSPFYSSATWQPQLLRMYFKTQK